MSEKSNKKGSAKKSAGCGKKDAAKKEAFKPVSRRGFLKAGALGALLIGGTTTAMLPLRKFKNDTSVEGFFQQHYERLTPERMDRILERIEGELKERHGVDVTVKDPKPIPGVQFAYALNVITPMIPDSHNWFQCRAHQSPVVRKEMDHINV